MSHGISSDDKRVAHCCCGSLRVETIREPLLVAACCCEGCQRRTGSAYGVSAFWPRENVETSGPAACYSRDGQDGRKVKFFFCPSCGTSVYWEVDFAPGLLGVAVGAFFDPKFPAPKNSIWQKYKPSWAIMPTSTHFAEQPTMV
jgi:hypothetical protein